MIKRVLNLGLLLLVGLLFTNFSQAQPPQKMTYQVVVRDAQNNLVVNQQIGVRISIVKSSLNGTPVYIERHLATTNHNGLLTLSVGDGVPNPGSRMEDIEWSNNDYYIKSEFDLSGGTQYTIDGGQQLVTVPYAFFSGSADYNRLINRPPDGSFTGDLLYWDATDSSWHIVPVGSAGQVLTLNPNGVPQWYSTIFNQNTPPTIVTDSIFNVTGFTLNVLATITDPGTTGIISSGVCWSSSNPFPSIGNNHTTDGSSVGSFISLISGLKSATLYYVRAYATNSVGTSYGNVLTITTPTHCGTVSDIDGNVYNTVYIGRQCWLKENLRTTRYADGNVVPIPVNTAQNPSGQNTHTQNNSSCYYFSGNDSVTKETRGLLYTWNAVMKGAGSSDNNPSGILGICPYGWHVPSSTEWCELENTLNPGIDVNCSNTGWRGTMAKALSKPEIWSTYTNNSFTPGYWTTDTTGFNTTDFSLIPAGYVYYNSYGNSYFNTDSQTGYSYTCVYNNTSWHTHYYYPNVSQNSAAHFWTSSSGKYRGMSYSETGIYYGTGEEPSRAFSLRCVKDY